HLHGVARRCGGDGRQKSRLSLVRVLLRLIADKHVNRKTTARVLRAGDELNRPAISQEDRFLAVSLAYRLDHASKVRMFTVVFEERGEPEESLTRRLHLMRCVQNAQAKDRQGVQLKDLDNGVLAVLPWHC